MRREVKEAQKHTKDEEEGFSILTDSLTFTSELFCLLAAEEQASAPLLFLSKKLMRNQMASYYFSYTYLFA